MKRACILGTRFKVGMAEALQFCPFEGIPKHRGPDTLVPIFCQKPDTYIHSLIILLESPTPANDAARLLNYQ
jgi:hypothetical protein